MLESYEKRKDKKWLYSKWMMGILVIMILFSAQAAWNVWEKNQMSADNLIKVEKERNKLLEREQKLKAELAELQTENGIEKELRAKFGVVKQGEQVVVIVEDESAKKEEIPEPEVKKGFRLFVSNFLGIFE